MKKKLAFLCVPALLLLLTSCKTTNTPLQVSPSPSASHTDTDVVSGNDIVLETAIGSPSPSEEVYVFTRDNFPRMDGSTSTIPLGQAIASVLLGEPRDAVAELAMFNKTSQSYRNLMNGECDIVIAAEGSTAVYEEMASAGFEYEQTPFANDALVFIVNASNPVDSLTIEQVQKIYTGEITNWNQVGGPDMVIEAFQRNTESGSQTLMTKLVMKELEMMTPPQGYTVGEMEGLIAAVRNFDGSATAIGYTVYYYAEDMKMADGLKILSIDGVAPNDETIASEAYPFINPYYAVIAAKEPADSPARILYNWLLSPEGGQLIKLEGYVPANG